MMKATAVAHPNIALVKYWGKRDLDLNLPAAGSVSLTLAGMETRTSVEFDEGMSTDLIQINGQFLKSGPKARRVVEFLDLVRSEAGICARARVQTVNDFPTSAGLASSASGFAALAVAATAAAGIEVPDEDLSVLARLGSGSAARSIFGGFVEMLPGTKPDGLDCHARQIAPASHWDLRCLIAITAEGEKAIGSTDGMLETQATSPYFQEWVDSVPVDIEAAHRAIADRDFEFMATIAERSCMRMHASAMAADPGILYWNGATVNLIHRVRRARRDGIPMFFTIDAGPHVKVFCPSRERAACETVLRSVPGVLDIITTRPGPGAHRVEL